MIACELFTRFHHLAQYDLFLPIYKQTIHYSKTSLKLAQTPKHRSAINKNYDYILSGGSVACSYGISNPKYTLDSLLNKNTLNLCQEGFTLKDEIDAISKLNPQNKTIIFVTGFNDAFLIDNIKVRQKARKYLLDKLYPLSNSLFVFKLVYKLTPKTKNPFSKEDYFKQLSRLKGLSKDNRVIVLHQPYLSPQKLKSSSEKQIYEQQQKHLKVIDFTANRAFIDDHLGGINLQDQFDTDPRDLFSDVCHLTELGNEKLAEVIAGVLQDE